jgi:hypothetical protein
MANSLFDGAAFFTGLSEKMEDHRVTKKALTKAARLVQQEAKRVLGTYDYGWPHLQEETVKHKATGDSPLLETGGLRMSIKYSVDAEEGIATVGTDDPKGLWMELGTKHIPPRSFLAGAAMRKEAEVHHICGNELISWVVTSRHPDFEDEWSYDGED